MRPTLLIIAVILLAGCNSEQNPFATPKAMSAVSAIPGIDYAAHGGPDTVTGPDYHVDPDETDPSTVTPGCTVFVGDSIVRLGDWSVWYPGVQTANQGVGGNTIEMVIARIDVILAQHPARIFLAVGTNDLNLGAPLGDIAILYRGLVAHIREADPGAQLFCESVLPVGHAFPTIWPMCFNIWDTILVNTAIQEACQDYGATYIDTWTPFAGPDGWAKDGLTSGSALHLSEAGYAVLNATLAPYVNQGELTGNG